ncbi:MAG: hypothetical protein AB7R67_23715 [Vicinamibacterales bacterium]
MLDAHPTSQDPEAITFASPEEADQVLQSYSEIRGELGSSAFFGGASAEDADTIAGMFISDEFYAVVAAARAYLAGVEALTCRDCGHADESHIDASFARVCPAPGCMCGVEPGHDADPDDIPC